MGKKNEMFIVRKIVVRFSIFAKKFCLGNETNTSLFFGVECSKVNRRSSLNGISLFIEFDLSKSNSFPECELVLEYDSNMLCPDCKDVMNLMISWDEVKCSTEV